MTRKKCKRQCCNYEVSHVRATWIDNSSRTPIHGFVTPCRCRQNVLLIFHCIFHRINCTAHFSLLYFKNRKSTFAVEMQNGKEDTDFNTSNMKPWIHFIYLIWSVIQFEFQYTAHKRVSLVYNLITPLC